MMTGFRQFEREFLSLASTWPVCRLAVMGGTSEHPAHVPVTNFDTLGWALLGCKDYACEMKLLVKERCGNEST